MRERDDARVTVVAREPGELAPRRVGVVAHAQGRSAVGGLRDRGAHDERAIGLPRDDVARVLRVEHHRPGVQVDPIDVENPRVARVRRDQHLVGKTRVDGERVRQHVVARRQLARGAAVNVRLKQMVVLVARAVLTVQHVTAVAAPAGPRNRAQRIVRDDAVVVRAERPDPRAQLSVVRREICDHRPVGRKHGRGALRVAEEHVAWDQRGRHVLLASSGRVTRYI